jgi:hypothetical protein
MPYHSGTNATVSNKFTDSNFCVLHQYCNYLQVLLTKAKRHFGVVISVRLRCGVFDRNRQLRRDLESGRKSTFLKKFFFSKAAKALVFLRTWIQHFRSMQIQIRDFDNQKCNILQVIKAFLPKIAIYFSLGLHKGRPSFMKSIQN